MQKNTVVFLVISALILGAFWGAQLLFFPPKPADPPSTELVTSTREPLAGTPTAVPLSETSLLTADEVSPAKEIAGTDTVTEDVPIQRVVIETDLLMVTLSNEGGDITSYKLKLHKDKNDYVDMIFGGGEPHAFTVAFGDYNATPVRSNFQVSRRSPYEVTFSKQFTLQNGKNFTLIKRYTFIKDEYMFQLDVALDTGGDEDFNFQGEAYTLSFGPQIGPSFEKADESQNYRRFATYLNGKVKQRTVKQGQTETVFEKYSWTSLSGKYFTFICVPDATSYTTVYQNRSAEGIPFSSRISFQRPPIRGRLQDVYRFYLGPKTQDALGIYDNTKNIYKYTDLNISRLAATSGFWSILNPLEALLKWLLNFFNGIVHNYGIAIMLVTLLVKAALFPLTKKSSEGTLRMQTLSPKIKELQTKYKDNPQKLNQEMAAFYKKEGYNPMSGCLPMLIQLPIFFALYNLFNNHFDLRGAMFIPGWIPDLSRPETFITLPFTVPLLGWTELHILPFLYVGSQLFYSKVTQTPDMQSNNQMKMMMYMMPVMFFFMLYNMPAGLSVYWIVSNVLTLGQQLIINSILRKKKAAMALANPESRFVEKSKRKKK
jgi:YidC/Oxa1 family membrane protein insertase